MSSLERAYDKADVDMSEPAQLQLDAKSMNEAMQTYTAAQQSEAAGRIKQHDAASGETCPAHMSVPGAATQVNAFRLVAVTGDRFLHAFQTPSAPKVPSKRAHPEADDDAPPSGASGGDATAQAPASPSPGDAAAAEAFVNIVESRAPERLTPQQVLDVVDVAQLFLADAVLAALPAYVKPMFGAAGLSEVASVLSGLTQTLSSRSSMHEPLLAMYRDAWPCFAAELGPLSGDVKICRADVQLLLTGSTEACVPPGRCVDFFLDAADQSDLPSGLRLFYILGATLALSALEPEKRKETKAEEAVAALLSAYLRSHRAHETLLMSRGLQRSLCQVLCLAQRDTACTAVHSLSEAVMLASTRLLTRAIPVLLTSQRSVGHVMAHSDARRRTVIAARLPADVEPSSTVSSFAQGFAVSVRTKLAPESAVDKTELGMFVHAKGASDENAKTVTATFGLAADSEAALKELVSASQHWCSTSEVTVPQRRSSLWETASRFKCVLKGPGHGYPQAFNSAACKAVGYDLVGKPDVIAIAWCEWPAPSSSGPATEEQGGA